MQVLTHQLKIILGVKTISRGSALEIVYLVYDICRSIADTNLMQLLISVISISTLVLVKQCINERFKYVYCFLFVWLVVFCDTYDTSILIIDTYVTIPVSPRSRYTAVYHSSKNTETAQVSRYRTRTTSESCY